MSVPSTPMREEFVPESPFLIQLLDVAGDNATQNITSQQLEDKHEQRKDYINFVANMACLQGKGVVSRILKDIDGAKTNREFLDSMKRIEALVRRIRERLTVLQILMHSRDPFGPLQFTQEIPQGKAKTGLLAMAGGTKEAFTSSTLAVQFLGELLPRLGRKYDAVLRDAHRDGPGEFREEHDFGGETYGQPKVMSSNTTDMGNRLWNGVHLGNRSTNGIKLAKLSLDPNNQNRIIPYNELASLISQENPPTEPAIKQALNIIARLFKEAQQPLPYEKIHGQGIRFRTSGEVVPQSTSPVSDGTFALNADFLDEPLKYDLVDDAPQTIVGDITPKQIDGLPLREDEKKFLLSMTKHEGTPRKMSEVLSETGLDAKFGVGIDQSIRNINDALKPFTIKRVIKTGAIITYKQPEV